MSRIGARVSSALGFNVPFTKWSRSRRVNRSRKAKLAGYGLQLREKQKVKRIYGVLEDQFRHYFETAERTRGITGETLLQLLERRLDNVVYRLGLATSRPQARQLVRHGHFLVNGKKVDIPSYSVRQGDVVISVERAVEQAEEGRGGHSGHVRWSAADELRLLITHGGLHLCGWDHALPVEEAAMRALERHLLGIDDDG